MQEAIETTAGSVTTKLSTVREELDSFKQVFTAQLQEQAHSFQLAQQAQQSQMNQGFQELKTLLQGPSSRAKRPAAAPPVQMEEED